MERKVIMIRWRTGNGLTKCDWCDNITWDTMTKDCYNEYTNTTLTLCSECLGALRHYWLTQGYVVKEPTIDG